MSYIKGAHNGADPTGASIAATFGSAVLSGSEVRGYVSWGTGVLGDLNTVTDDKGNSYTIVDKVTDGSNSQSFGSFYLANITNGPTIITANLLNTPVARSIVVGEYSNMQSGANIDGHAMILRSAPGAGTDAVTTGNFTTTVAGDTVTSAVIDSTIGSLATVAVGTGYGAEEADATATVHIKTEDLVQGAASASTNGTWTDATNGGTHSYIVGGMAFKPASVAVSPLFVGAPMPFYNTIHINE